MTKRLIFFCSIAILLMTAWLPSAYAAREFKVRQPQLWSSAFVTLDPAGCSGVQALAKAGNSGFKDIEKGTCVGLDEAMTTSVVSFNYVVSGLGTWPVNISRSGSCIAGTAAGSQFVSVAYVNYSTLAVLQQFRDPLTVTGVRAGCQIKASEVGGAFYDGVVNGVALKHVTVYFVETGADGGGEQTPDDSVPEYGGSGSGGGTGGDTGGGTGGGGTGGDTGGGGTGGGGTGGGGTGGGGTGDDGSGGGGTGGDGGTGGGGTGGGDTQQNCGAPGQPACKIDESGTPTGSGMLDALMKLVEGIGDDRQKGLDDAKSDADKDTSLPFSSLSLPSGSCVNPTVSLPGFGGSWTVDICSYVDMLGSMFEAFWAFAFAFAVMSMVSRATAKPVA
jgi:hypothetical protein